MRTLGIDGWSCNFNSDLSGDVQIHIPTSDGHRLVHVPGKLVLAIAADAIRRERIYRLEQMSDAELLGLKEE